MNHARTLSITIISLVIPNVVIYMNRDAKAVLALGFMSFLHNRRAMIIVGAVLIGVGAAGAISIEPVLI